MSLRGDFQGGSHGGEMGLGGGDGKIAIEKLLKWNWAFFGGAAIVSATAIGTGIHWIGHFTFAPATFFSEVFLILFGAVMLLLDMPIPHMANHPHIRAARFQTYKYALFLTRFTGRGVWYLFLATMVFGVLWDTGLNLVLGGLFTAYLMVLGALALAKGILMSRKLQRVRETISLSGGSAERFLSANQNALSTDQFAVMIKTATQEVELFTRDELDYIVNALAFGPYNDGHVSLEELQYWLSPGVPLVV